MANRYWVGGSGNWSDNTNHWSDSSGGSPGASLPTSSDDVFIDANSGFGSGGTIYLDGQNTCRDITCSSGHTFTIDESSGRMNCYGSVIFESGLTLGDTSRTFLFQQTTGNYTITTNGASLKSYFEFGWYGGDATFTLLDDFSTEGSFDFYSGTFDANDHNVTANNFYFYANTGYTPTVIMGNGTWEATGVGDETGFFIDQYSDQIVTFIPETSTIKLSGSSEGFYFFDDTGNETGKTFNNLWITTSDISVITGSNTFNELKIDAPITLYFISGTTTSVSSFVAVGDSENLITLNLPPEDTGQFILSKSSGIVSCDYLDISNSNATGGATWYAGSHSADTTNNDGWLFEDAPTPLSPKVTVKNKLNLLSIGSL